MILTTREINAVLQSCEVHKMTSMSTYAALTLLLDDILQAKKTEVEVPDDEYFNLIKRQAQEYESWKRRQKRR